MYDRQIGSNYEPNKFDTIGITYHKYIHSHQLFIITIN